MRRNGRPPIDPSGRRAVTVGLALPAGQFDEYCRQAHRDRVSVAEVIRRLLQGNKKQKTSPPDEMA